jgi:aminopeptidase N
MRLTGFLLLFLFSLDISAQYGSGFSPDAYRGSGNPLYWKGRGHDNSYWQQDVHYKIKAKVDDKTDIIDASEELSYFNNSPDTLAFVYFHLYQNAFQPGSYTNDLHKNNKYPIKYGPYESQKLGTVVSNLKVNGSEVKTELDNTILKVWLPKPLLPNESVKLTMDFKTYFDSKGSVRRRMKMFNAYGYKHYDGVHWYPRISVYDRKQGWDTDQHLTREFYGDFGSFDVELTFANNFVLDATGVLINKSEVLPDTLRQKLDIRNFAKKPLYSAPSVIITPDGTWKTWKFQAINVHDFAFTADPTYRIGEAEWNGIKCIALVQEPHASRWQNAASYTAKVIEVNSTDFGLYEYPKMIVADARDGMEYPMLTLDGGLDPDYRDLLAHEVGHNWFFGMVGSNETYRAALDEGFTQFLTGWTYERIDGKYRVRGTPKSDYVRRFLKPDLVRESEVYNGYIFDAAQGDETTLNTHSDMFGGALRHGGGYRQVYMKTATMLYNLQYVLGDELFLKAMQNYVKEWKMAHPYWEDFKSSIIRYTKVDLNWFFDQWFETSKTIDYGVKSVKKGDNKDEYVITFERKGMQMPIDFEVVGHDSSRHKFYIPNTWFEKKTDAKVLPRWIGFDNISKTYKATVTIPGGITNVIIDPSNRLADVNMLDNSFIFPVAYSFDSKIYNVPDWKKYEVFYRPDLWYNGYDGLKLGVAVNGNYMNYRHVFDAAIWFNSGVLQNKEFLDTGAYINKYDNISFRVNYRTATDKFMKRSGIFLSARLLDGLNAYVAGFDKKNTTGKDKYTVFFKSMIRQSNNDLNYLLTPNEWETKKLNNTVNLGYEHNYNYRKGNGNLQLGLRSSSLMSDYDYAQATLTAVNRNDLGKININTRTFIGYGTGSSTPRESHFYAAGANPEEMMENKYTRAQGFFPPEWAEYGPETNHFHHGGGLNLRGYAGYLLPEEDENGVLRYSYRGTAGASVNAEIEFQELVKFNPKFLKNTFKLATYVFGDAGVINYNYAGEDLKIGKLRADAGVGTALTIQKWGPLQTVKPLVIRFDMPLFLNRIPATNDDYVQFRWIIGVNRAF